MNIFRGKEYDAYGREVIDLGRCRFKGGSTTVNNTSTYTPTEYELELQKAQSDYSKAVAPNALYLNRAAKDLLSNSLGEVQVDYDRLNRQAQEYIDQAMSGYQDLYDSNTQAADSANRRLDTLYGQYSDAANRANRTLASLEQGNLPTGYQQAMENSIATAINNTMGKNINSLGQRGVLNSSVTNAALNDISKNAADTVAQQYQTNINTVGNLANQQFGNKTNSLNSQANLTNQQIANTLNANNANTNILGNVLNGATAGITTAAAAQEAAQQPAINLWNASLGLNGATTGALAAAAGKGTTQSTSTTSGGSGGGFLSGLMGGLF